MSVCVCVCSFDGTLSEVVFKAEGNGRFAICIGRALPCLPQPQELHDQVPVPTWEMDFGLWGGGCVLDKPSHERPFPTPAEL